VRPTGAKRSGNFTESGSRIKKVFENILSNVQMRSSLGLRPGSNGLQRTPAPLWLVSDSRLCRALEMTHVLKGFANAGKIALYKT
jgi:hypothetical protein